MKKATALIMFLGWVFFVTAVQAATYDATGRWNYSVSGHWNNCDEPPEPSESGTAVVLQTANTFLLVSISSTAGTLKTVSGTINGASYQFSDRYWEDGGWTNETVKFTLSSSSSGSGSATWNWSDGVNSCSGGYSLSMSKQSQTTPSYNASGTWSFSEKGFWNNCSETNPVGDSGTITINQNGSSINATDSKGGGWQGFVSGATYTFVDSYAEDDGITSDVCTVDLSSAFQGRGQCWWVWDLDGNSNDNCQGGSNISITKHAGTTSQGMPWLPLLLFDEKPALSSIVISGPPQSQVNESSGAQYTCTAYYSDGSNKNVTSNATWSDNCSYASISTSGYLTTQAVSANQSCTITAQYGGKSDTQAVTIIDQSLPPITITISSLPTTDNDGNYTLEWSVTGLAATPWIIQEDSNTNFTNPTTYLSYDNTSPYTRTFSNKPNGTYCYRVGLSGSGFFSSPACVTVSIPVQTRQITINNQITAGLNLQQVVQVKVSATNSFSRSDLLTDDPAKCLYLPGEAIDRGGSRTFDITIGNNYYVFIGIGTWDLDNFFCSYSNPWFKRRFFTDPDFYTYYVYTIVVVSGHSSGNWNWTISGSYLNRTLVVTPSGSNPIYFTVTQNNPIP